MVFDFDGTLAVLNIDFSLMKERVFLLIRDLGIDEESIREQYLLEIIDEVCGRLRRENPIAADTFYENAHHILHEIELNAAAEGRLISGTEAALTDLGNRGVKVGIVTRNCEDAVRRVFPNIDAFCDVFLSRNSVKRVKPHPDHLTSMMKALNVASEEAVMVGDHVIDIQAGQSVGMKTIGVLTGRTKKEAFEGVGADYILNEVTEICTLFE